MSKSSDKPKKQQKQTLNGRRNEKRAAKKVGSKSFIPAVK
jgi:hypothetical protein